MEEGDVPDIVGSSVVNSPNLITFRWLPDFSWVSFDRVNVEEKSKTENTELVGNDVIHDSDFEASFSPVIPHQAFVVSRAEMANVNSENSSALFKPRNGENQIFSDTDKAGGDENNDYNDNTQNGDYNNSDDCDKRTGIRDIKDGDDDSCSTTSEILISVTDLRHCSLFEATDAKELSRRNDQSPNSGNKEEVINTKSMELLDSTGSTQDERYSDWRMTVSNQETGDKSGVKIGAGLFAISSHVEIAGETFAMPIDCETDVRPTAVVRSAETFKGPLAMANDDAGLTAVLDDAVSVIGPVAMADDAEMSAEPITVSDDEELVETTITMANHNGTVERPIAMVNDDAVLDDGEYVQRLFPVATVAEQPAIVIAVSDDDDDDELASKLCNAECDVELSIQPVAANAAELAEKDSQHVSELSWISLRKTAEDNRMGTGHCGLQNEKAASRVAEMEISTELEASSLEDLETQQTESSVNHNHRKEIEKILKTERLLFTVQQSLENDFQESDSVFELLNDVQKLLQELHASQSLETQSIARKMELLGKYKGDRSLLLYEGKLLKIRRTKLIGLSKKHQQLYEKALSLSTQLETEPENRIVCNYSFSTARKPQEQVNTIRDDETIVERNFNLNESNSKKSLSEASSNRKTVRFTLPDSVGTASQARKFNVEERDTCQQSQKISHGSRLVHHNEKDHQLVPVECSTQTSSIPISDSVTERQIQVVSSYTNSNRKATGNCLKRSNGLAPVVTACKVSKASGSGSNATQGNVYATTFMKEYSENIYPQTSKISPEFVIAASSLTTKKDVLAPLEKFSQVNPGGAEKVLNSMPSSNGTIYEVNCRTVTSAVTTISDANGIYSRKPDLLAYKLPMSLTTASLKTSTAKFTSEPSGICSRKLDVPEHRLPVSVTTTLMNRQSIAPQIYMYRFASAPSLLSTHTVTAPSGLHSPMTSSVFNCPSSVVAAGNYQQANCTAVSQPTRVYNIKQSLCHPLSATSVINSNIKQKLQQMPVMPVPTLAEKVLLNSHSGGQIFNVKDLHKTGSTSEVFTPAGCQSVSQSKNISSNISLKHLINDKLIQPGVNVLSARCKNGQVFASITPSGHIKNDRGQIFKSIRAWYLDAVELDTASQATIYQQVLYYGVPVKTIVSGSKDLENSSQDSPTEDCLLTNSSKRSQMPAKQDEDLLLKNISTSIGFLHLHSEAELEPCDKWVWSSDFTLCSPSWLETIDDWK